MIVSGIAPWARAKRIISAKPRASSAACALAPKFRARARRRRRWRAHFWPRRRFRRRSRRLTGRAGNAAPPIARISFRPMRCCSAANVTAVGSPRARSAAKLGPESAAAGWPGRTSARHVAHEKAAVPLDALGATDDGGPWPQMSAHERRCLAHGLGGNDGQHMIGVANAGDVGDGSTCSRQHDAGQAALVAPRFAHGQRHARDHRAQS